MTTNVRKMSRSRFGTSSGIASAAASETAPRIPAQATIETLRHAGRAAPGSDRTSFGRA